MRTFGVEEELLLVDAATGVPVALADLVARRGPGGREDDDAGPATTAAGATAPPNAARAATAGPAGAGPVVSTGAAGRPGATAGAIAACAPLSTASAPANGNGRHNGNGNGEDEADELVPELQREQIETDTSPCSSLDELASQLAERRSMAARAAHRMGAEVAALATSPLPVEPSIGLDERYRRMAELYAMTAQEQLTCGCHVHVSVASEDEGVAVLDRIRPWLPPLLAVSANSPFWQGRDSGYSSYRRQVWGRWPSSGPTGLFGTPRVYHETVSAMLETGALLDEGMVYFDARLSRRYPTVEIRVADVCLRVTDAVLLASLARALVETAAREWRDGRPPQPVRTESLHLASWRASRSGLGGDLVHPVTGRAEPAEAVIRALLDHAGDALAAADAEADHVGATNDLVQALLARGNGAILQRKVYGSTGELPAVVRNAVAHTLTVE
ncbi:MAG TPA: glutamate--cysteine ligase [Streptosporangiaceae bacterium]|nr:glutamate--cysteine ligase [Streptosporangiaceae bacterium]